MPRWNDDVRKTFLETFALTGRVKEAASAAGVSWGCVNDRRRRDPDFDAEYQEALQEWRDKIEKTFTDRVLDGIPEPVFWQGEICGHIKKFDTRLSELVLKKNVPEFREKLQVEATVQGGVLVVSKPAETEAEWIASATAAEKKAKQNGG